MKNGDLVKLSVWKSFPLSSRHNSDDTIETIYADELLTVLKIGKANVKILSPRGKIGWIWKPRLEVV
jgi:hypothetical protein